MWDKILRSQLGYTPTEFLLEEYKNAYLGFRLQEALKTRILIMILDERIDHLNHYMRLLYSPSEVLFNTSESIKIVYLLLDDYNQNELNRTTTKKLLIQPIHTYFKLVAEEVEITILDHHNIICEGNQVKILNHLSEITKYMPTIEELDFPENLEVLDLCKGKLRSIENDLKVMSSISVLYSSDYLKSVYKINLYDNPLLID